jgi:hypothetical protein
LDFLAEEYIGLDDHRFIGDLLIEFKASKERSKGEIIQCKLVFKKRLFRESDETITEPMFVQLSYVQVVVVFCMAVLSNLCHIEQETLINTIFLAYQTKILGQNLFVLLIAGIYNAIMFI